MFAAWLSIGSPVCLEIGRAPDHSPRGTFQDGRGWLTVDASGRMVFCYCQIPQRDRESR